MTTEEFVQLFLLDEVKKMQEAGVQLHLLSAMVHGIETAGALLDPLPFKAKGQGRKRFNRALKTLFPTRYTQAGLHVDLYGQLRSHMAHCMLPSNLIQFVPSSRGHLEASEKLVLISLDDLYHDYLIAIEKLLQKLQSEELKAKRVSLVNLEELVGSK